MINNELETKSNFKNNKKEDEEEKESFKTAISASLTSIKPTSTLEPINESKILDEIGSTLGRKTLSPRLSNVNYRHNRSRSDSLRQLTDKFRSFSIDIVRSIENAHEMADLKHSNFSAATQTAAANAALCHHNLLYDYPIQNESKTESQDDFNENYTCSKTSYKSSQTFDSNSETESAQGSNKIHDVPLDEINIKDQEDVKRVNFENNQNVNINNSNNNVDTSDQVDFSTRKRFIIKDGTKKSIPDDIHISILEVFIYLWGVITFFADLISDIILGFDYYHSSRIWLAIMTMMFVIVPNFTLSLFSLSWYIDKYVSEKKIQEQKFKHSNNAQESHLPNTPCQSITFWIMTVLFVMFQLDLVWKYIQGFIYTLKGWACRSIFHNLKWEKYYIEKQIKCDTDIGMLRLIDVFLDSGPQVLLQLYVITTQNLNEIGSAKIVVFTFKDFQTTSTEIKQLISILSSLFSMGYALAGYHRCLRNQQFIFSLETNKPLPRPMRWISTIMQFIWYLILIAPRVLSMALFASTFRSWFFMIIFTHWLIMYFWILRLKTNYCITSEEVYSAREQIFEKFYDLVCSFIYIFVYFNLKAGPTRYRYLIYYIIYYCENILFCTCYFLFSKEQNFAYKLSLLLIVVFGFWIAITFQIVYYLHCHPSHKIQVCVRESNKFYFIHKKMLKATDFYDLSESYLANEENFKNSKDDNQKQIVTVNEKNDSGKTSSSSSSITNENENSASTLKLITTLQNGEILPKQKDKNKIFKNKFTKFINLYSSTDTNFTSESKNNQVIEVKRSSPNDSDQKSSNTLFLETQQSQSPVLNSDNSCSSLSIYSKKSSLKSFKSVKSLFKSDCNQLMNSNSSSVGLDKFKNNNKKSIFFSITEINRPMVDLKEVLDSQELYDNISYGDKSKKCTVVRSKSSCSFKKKEAFL
ncbi:unnamed protein product [Brachionus calyciflorus]|uniref:XK-related protein n=1 Tax=Brachionus calyciflorus TaxID=104777 RepID=A0A813M6K1_9BILA|nr:unnamed protein product [Brachionus calyciflorus]